MFDKLCSFCSCENEELHPIAGNTPLKRFSQLLQINLLFMEGRLPQSICTLCNLKVNETVNFYDQIIESHRKLRIKLCLPIESISSSTDTQTTSKNDKVYEILSNIKTKGSVSIAKISMIPDDKLIKREPSPFFCETNSMTYSSVSDAGDQEADSEDSLPDDSDYEEQTSTHNKKLFTKNERSNTTIVEIIEPKYVCARCREKFTTLDNLNDHLDNSITCKDKNVKCEPCNKMFSTRRQYQKHVNGVHQKKVTSNICERCKRKFTTPNDLEKHSIICTGDFGEERSGILFKCRECYKTFTKKHELMEHIQNHPCTLLCETCGKSCETRKQYHQHKSKHLNLKPYGCDSCDKRFATRTVLLAHQHVHTGIKRYVCDTCGKSFAKKSSLTVHIRVHTGETPYECRECMAKFPTLDRLKNHLKKHQENNCYVY